MQHARRNLEDEARGGLKVIRIDAEKHGTNKK